MRRSSVPYLHCSPKVSSIHIPILLTGKLKLREVKTKTQKAQSWEMLELDANPGYPRPRSRPRSLALPPRWRQPKLARCPVTGILSAISSGPWSGPPIVVGLCRKPLLWHRAHGFVHSLKSPTHGCERPQGQTWSGSTWQHRLLTLSAPQSARAVYSLIIHPLSWCQQPSSAAIGEAAFYSDRALLGSKKLHGLRVNPASSF